MVVRLLMIEANPGWSISHEITYTEIDKSIKALFELLETVLEHDPDTKKLILTLLSVQSRNGWTIGHRLARIKSSDANANKHRFLMLLMSLLVAQDTQDDVLSLFKLQTKEEGSTIGMLFAFNCTNEITQEYLELLTYLLTLGIKAQDILSVIKIQRSEKSGSLSIFHLLCYTKNATTVSSFLKLLIDLVNHGAEIQTVFSYLNQRGIEGITCGHCIACNKESNAIQELLLFLEKLHDQYHVSAQLINDWLELPIQRPILNKAAHWLVADLPPDELFSLHGMIIDGHETIADSYHKFKAKLVIQFAPEKICRFIRECNIAKNDARLANLKQFFLALESSQLEKAAKSWSLMETQTQFDSKYPSFLAVTNPYSELITPLAVLLEDGMDELRQDFKTKFDKKLSDECKKNKDNPDDNIHKLFESHYAIDNCNNLDNLILN